MSLDTPFTLAKTVRLAPVEPHHAPLFCFALLTVSCALASFALACATPFAAFAVLAAAMLPLRPFPGNVLRKVRGAQGHSLDFGTAQEKWLRHRPDLCASSFCRCECSSRCDPSAFGARRTTAE
jgi:hypothetical protein